MFPQFKPTTRIFTLYNFLAPLFFLLPPTSPAVTANITARHPAVPSFPTLPGFSLQVRIFIYFLTIKIVFLLHFSSPRASEISSSVVIFYCCLYSFFFLSYIFSFWYSESTRPPLFHWPHFLLLFPLGKFLHSYILHIANFFPWCHFSCNFPLTVNIFSFFSFAKHFRVPLLLCPPSFPSDVLFPR